MARGRNGAKWAAQHARESIAVLATVVLRADEIIIDEEWNCRSDGGSRANILRAELPGDEQSDKELVEDIETRGPINPVRVRKIGRSTYKLTCGFRRLKAIMAAHGPETDVLCTVQCSTGDEEADAFRAMTDNLAENLNRRKLRPFEIAEALYRLHMADEDRTLSDLAKEVGLSFGYVCNLVRVRKNACPELWAVFVAHGDKYPAGINFKDLLRIVKRPKPEQLEAWAKLVEERTGGHKQRNPRHFRRASVRQLKGYLAKCGTVERSADYVSGLRYGLRLALGRQHWKSGDTQAVAKESES